MEQQFFEIEYKPFFRIATSDDKYYVLISRGTNWKKRYYMDYNFGMYKAFDDAIDALDYIEVTLFYRTDYLFRRNMCTVEFDFRDKGNTTEYMNRLIEDIQDIMDKIGLNNHK